MKKTRTYIFDALVNLIAQSVLFFIGMFVWVNPVYEVIWRLPPPDLRRSWHSWSAALRNGAARISGTILCFRCYR